MAGANVQHNLFQETSRSNHEKYDLAPDYDDRLGGDLAHIIVMQHVTKERMQNFLNDLAAAK